MAISELEQLIGGLLEGDSIVWEVNSGTLVERLVSNFIADSEASEVGVIYVSFNRSPSAIFELYGRLMGDSRFTLVDCFSAGKGNNDETFLSFYNNELSPAQGRSVFVENPTDPEALTMVLREIGTQKQFSYRFVFDSITGAFSLWGDEDTVLKFFSYICPRLSDLNMEAYWFLEKDAHAERFMAHVRHIAPVVIEMAIERGNRSLKVKKAANRNCPSLGIPQSVRLEDDKVVITRESREDRELGLLTRMGTLLGSALDPNFFFQQTMEVLASELGMMRGTLILLDRASNRLRIVAAHGLSPEERNRGEYAIGEGITGHVVATGLPEIVPDISKDHRFLNRTATREMEPNAPISFICVPVKVDDAFVGALSVDRPFFVEATIQKDLRLLTIVASIIAQALKINQLVTINKEDILQRDQKMLSELTCRYRIDNIVGQSRSIQKVLGTAATAAKSRASILITGETGTGKELIANVIHYNSPRCNGPFVKVNCGALPENLLESELFGHIKGAFTGAINDRKGRFQLASGGTLFLDEVSEMSPRLQVKLLRVLQEMEFEPVGSMRTVRVDVRVVAATNRDLRSAVDEGRFRPELYYRLNVIPIVLPSLCERREDIPLLVDHFIEKYNKANEKRVTKLSQGVLDRLFDHSWPGNIRELENCIERAVVMSPKDTLTVDLLPDEIVTVDPGRMGTFSKPSSWREVEIRQAVENFCKHTGHLGEARDLLNRVVDESIFHTALECGISQRKLAEELGMSRMTLRKKIQGYYGDI